jgi:predicted exporter
VPPALLARDSALRKELGAPDIRHLLVIEDKDAQSVLEKAAALDSRLETLVTRGQLDGYDHAARYLPPRQSRSVVALRCPIPRLRAALNEALGTTPFKPGIFEPFLADVERARQLPALGPSTSSGPHSRHASGRCYWSEAITGRAS